MNKLCARLGRIVGNSAFQGIGEIYPHWYMRAPQFSPRQHIAQGAGAAVISRLSRRAAPFISCY